MNNKEIAKLFDEAQKSSKPVKPTTLKYKSNHIKPFTANEILKMDLPPIKHLAKGLFEEGSLIYIVGTPGSCKSMFTMFTTLCLAEKQEMFNNFKIDKSYKTLWIDEENGLRRTKHKLQRLMSTMQIETDKVLFSSMNGFRINYECVKELEILIKREKPDIIVLDSFIRVFEGDERGEEVKVVHRLLKPLIEKYNLSIFILHHLRKENVKLKGARTLDDIRGSGDLGGQCDQAFLLQRYGEVTAYTKTFNCIPLKEKDGLEGQGFSFKVTGNPEEIELRFSWDGYIEENIEEAYNKTKADILQCIRDNNGAHLNLITKTIKHSKTTINKVLKGLIEDEVLTTVKVGRRMDYVFADSTIGTQHTIPIKSGED